MVGNKIKVDYHNEWLANQRLKELLENNDKAGNVFSANGSGNAVSSGEVFDLEPRPMAPAPARIEPEYINVNNMIATDQLFNGTSQMVSQQQPFFFGGNNAFQAINHNPNSHSIPLSVADLTPSVMGNQGMAPTMTTTTTTTTHVPPSHAAAPSLPNMALFPSQPRPMQPRKESPSCTSDSATNLAIAKASKYDVLFGRGKVKEHYGNVYLHKLIAFKQDRYEASERWEKTVIAEEIVSIIREHGGRFLKLNPTAQEWVEVDSETAREKVSHTFRSRRPKGHVSQKATTAVATAAVAARRNPKIQLVLD
jgi:hypothetical protein